MDTKAEPAFAWYRLEGRESATILIIGLFFVALCFIVFLGGEEPAPLRSRSEAVPQAAVFVNRAGVAELSALPGIGPRKAERIIEARRERPIRNLEELARAAGGIPQVHREKIGRFARFDE